MFLALESGHIRLSSSTHPATDRGGQPTFGSTRVADTEGGNNGGVAVSHQSFIMCFFMRL